MRGGVYIKGCKEGGQGFPDLAFCEGDVTRALRDSEHRGVGREGKGGRHGSHCSQGTERRGPQAGNLNSCEL